MQPCACYIVRCDVQAKAAQPSSQSQPLGYPRIRPESLLYMASYRSDARDTSPTKSPSRPAPFISCLAPVRLQACVSAQDTYVLIRLFWQLRRMPFHGQPKRSKQSTKSHPVGGLWPGNSFPSPTQSKLTTPHQSMYPSIQMGLMPDSTCHVPGLFQTNKKTCLREGVGVDDRRG